MEMSEAEAVKHRVGLGEEASEKIAAVIRDAIRPLINEIRSSFAYLTSAEQHVQIARLALSGGGSRLAGLEQLLHEQLGVEVIQADPVAHLRQGPAPGGSGSGTGNQGKEDPLLAKLVAEQASSAVSIGLTLGEAA
jgi:type IV pilus assembly protein PilM